MKVSPAFTLIELLIVAALLSLVSIVGFTAYTTAHDNQLVNQTAQYVADTMQRASNYSQTARDDKVWGVKSDDQLTYDIISKTADNQQQVTQINSLPKGVQFQQPFIIWFQSGTGTIDQDTAVSLATTSQRRATISIATTGIISVKAQ